ncbi:MULTISPECIES: sulfatase [Salegentibacter]|uniref:Arylsulfatase A n=1 Tax=Salegentibacter agarivorans TaxID=345907 RepID=A0A1I2N5W5_9FLAO|nr:MULTISPECIES: sulfatase [Salegentibacter]SFF96791.1 Arylsulfatase A [Salegentibacter agarivorans]
MKNLYFIFFYILFIIFSTLNAQEQKPNVVLFLVDDMGWQDTSVPFWTEETAFNKLYHTPNMERLAKKGTKFTQAYATPICSPSRVSILTGANAARHRVTNWTLDKNESKDAADEHLEFPRWNMNGISNNEDIPNSFVANTLPELLKMNGYYTIHAGKAHLGAKNTPGENPLNLGFDVNITGHAAGAPESFLGTENFGNGKAGKSEWAVPGLEEYHGKDIFLTEAITREALQSLDEVVGKKPFFLHMSHYAVHVPIMADERFYQKYLDTGLDKTEAKYASMVEGMDKSLGDIMDYLEENNLEENTIILFMSDNGGLSAHARGGEPHTHNTPLNSGKGSAYEGGIRVPMLVYWPEKTKPASSIDDYVIIEDFFPSILEMTKSHIPALKQKVDGQSFVSLIEENNQSRNQRPLFWHYPNKWGGSGPGIATFSAIRKGDYKLIYYHKDRRFELFNIRKDIGETSNISETHTKKTKELATILSLYLESVDGQMPLDKRTNKKVELPIKIFK